MKTRWIGFLLALTPCLPAQELIVNGSFEDFTGATGGPHWTNVPGWYDVAGPNDTITIRDAVWAPDTGSYACTLYGGNEPDHVVQIVPTSPGGAYQLSFAWKPRNSTNASAPVSQNVHVTWNGSVVYSDTVPTPASEPAYTYVTLTLTATAASTTLGFYDNLAGGGTIGSVIDSVSLVLSNAAPIANAGPDQSVTAPVGQAVVLDGSDSSDDGASSAALQYAWILIDVPAGSGAVLMDASTSMPSFVPDIDGDYTAELVVTDEQGATSTPDQVLISVAVDHPPTANAGSDQLAFTGAIVPLDGSLSTDDLTASASLLYAWTITSAPAGSTAVLIGDASSMPTLIPDLAGDYTVDLVVTDSAGQASPADQVVISAAVPNAAPTADAGSDATVAVNVAHQLDGTASADPDFDALNYQWTLTSAPAGSAAMLVGADTATPSLTGDLEGTYVVGLVVNDGFVDSPADSVEIEAIDTTDFVRAKILEAYEFLASLPLSSFYSGHGGGAFWQALRAKISKLEIRLLLRLAALDAYLLDRTVQSGGSPHQIRARQKATLRALRAAILVTDGVALRGIADDHGLGFRADLIIEASAALSVYDCLQLAIAAVEAVQ